MALFCMNCIEAAATAKPKGTRWKVLVKLGALDLTHVWVDGEWWRVLTTGFLHGSLLHLLLNMTALGSIGDWVEHAWGPWRSLLLFLASSVGGCLASLMWCESQMVVDMGGAGVHGSSRGAAEVGAVCEVCALVVLVGARVHTRRAGLSGSGCRWIRVWGRGAGRRR